MFKFHQDAKFLHKSRDQEVRPEMVTDETSVCLLMAEMSENSELTRAAADPRQFQG